MTDAQSTFSRIKRNNFLSQNVLHVHLSSMVVCATISFFPPRWHINFCNSEQTLQGEREKEWNRRLTSFAGFFTLLSFLLREATFIYPCRYNLHVRPQYWLMNLSFLNFHRFYLIFIGNNPNIFKVFFDCSISYRRTISLLGNKNTFLLLTNYAQFRARNRMLYIYSSYYFCYFYDSYNHCCAHCNILPAFMYYSSRTRILLPLW